MQFFITYFKKDIFPISLILILSFSRLIPHPPNFTPIIAATILSSIFFNKSTKSISVVIISFLITDIILGFYPSMMITYLSLILLILLSHNFFTSVNFKNLFFYSLTSSVIFFLLSNFGFWMFSGLYEISFSGLLKCFYMAIPFFKNTILSTIIFSYTFLVIYKLPKNYSIK